MIHVGEKLFTRQIQNIVMTNLDSIFKSRDITLPTKVRLVKAMVFPVVMYGCESWTVKKAECQTVDAFELWCWRRLFRLLGVWGFPRGSVVKTPPTNARDTGDAGSIPGSGRSPGGGNGNPLQYSCLGNPMDRGAWWAAVHQVAKSWTPLSMHAQLGV